MPKLTIVAHIFAKPDQIEFVKAELQKIIAPTLAEEGCLQYDLHQDNEEPELKGKNQDGKEIALKAADGDQWMVIFTYPKALTGG